MNLLRKLFGGKVVFIKDPICTVKGCKKIVSTPYARVIHQNLDVGDITRLPTSVCHKHELLIKTKENYRSQIELKNGKVVLPDVWWPNKTPNPYFLFPYTN